MRLFARVAALASLGFALLAGAAACGPDVDDEFPPGNPIVDESLPSSEADADEAPRLATAEDDTNYGLWGLVGVCLIGAGVLLVKVEAWERRNRTSDD